MLWLPASPTAGPPGTAETPLPHPWTNTQSFPRTGHWRLRNRCGREGVEEWDGALPPVEVLLTPFFLVSPLIFHCPPPSVPVPLGWALE